MSCDRPDWTAQCALLVLVATGGLAAQKPHKLAELRELNEVDWAVDDTPPAWWLMPRRESGAFPLATREEHARRRLARGFLDVDACRRDLRWQLFGHLRPALGHADARRAIDGMLRCAELAEAVMVEEGNRSATLYLRWRIPIVASLSDFDPREFGRIERLLLADIVRWRQVEKAPDWVDPVPPRRGYFRCALTFGGDRREEAARTLVESTRESLRRQLRGLVAPAVAPGLADEAIEAALDRVVTVQRAVRAIGSEERKRLYRRPKFVCYQLSEVPLAPLLAKLPPQVAPAVEVMLRQQ